MDGQTTKVVRADVRYLEAGPSPASSLKLPPFCILLKLKLQSKILYQKAYLHLGELRFSLNFIMYIHTMYTFIQMYFYTIWSNYSMPIQNLALTSVVVKGLQKTVKIKKSNKIWMNGKVKLVILIHYKKSQLESQKYRSQLSFSSQYKVQQSISSVKSWQE